MQGSGWDPRQNGTNVLVDLVDEEQVVVLIVDVSRRPVPRRAANAPSPYLRENNATL